MSMPAKTTKGRKEFLLNYNIKKGLIARHSATPLRRR